MPRMLWLADVARAAGLVVVEVDGWQTRGSDTMNPKGVINHHTAGPSTGDLPTLGVLVNGRPDLPGPLSQYGLGRSGTVYVIASGKANHAGAGQWQGVDFLDLSTDVIGIEAEHTGHIAEKWPEAQLDAWRILNAAILNHLGKPVANLCAHKEWAQPPESTPNRKPDPIWIDMNAWRASVDDILRRWNMADIKVEAGEGDVQVEGAAAGVDPAFVGPFEWAKAMKIFTEHTNPDSVITSEEFAAFLDRYHRLVVAPNLGAGAAGLKRGDTVTLG